MSSETVGSTPSHEALESVPSPAEKEQADRAVSKLLVKNTSFLLGAQILALPISIFSTALLGRYLGAEDFGSLYLATTFCTFGFLVAEWGQGSALTTLIARHKERSPEFLGTALATRVPMVLLAYGALMLVASYLGQSPRFFYVLTFVAISQGLGSFSGAFLNAIRGFERTDIPAVFHLGQQFVTAALFATVLYLGAGLSGVIFAQIAIALCVLPSVARANARLGTRGLSFHGSSVLPMLKEGFPFLILGLSTSLQPNIDAFFLVKYASPEAVGWHAAANKLIGTLIMPATTIIAALYPTLCRLAKENEAAFRRTANGALSTTTLLVVPVALGCFFYPDIGIRLLGENSFAPAETNLRILSVFLFLVYFTVVISTILVAAGRQRPWSAVQVLCILVSLILDPILIPYFQEHYGNGGLGVSIGVVISEVLMLTGGLLLAPRGTLDSSLARGLGSALVGGATMTGAALTLRGFSPFLSAPLAVAAYLLGLGATGGLSRERLSLLSEVIRRKANKT